jgi:hypothetical protein
MSIIVLNSANRTRSNMKTIFPMVWSPVNVFGVFPRTTARAPVDMVHANHGLHDTVSLRRQTSIGEEKAIPCEMRKPVAKPYLLWRLLLLFLIRAWSPLAKLHHVVCMYMCQAHTRDRSREMI